MKKNIVSLPSRGMRLVELGKSLRFNAALHIAEDFGVFRLTESMLDSNAYQGFPIVRSPSDHTLLGDIARSDLVSAIRM